MRPLRGALIGCGFVARHHLDGWRRIPDAELVAICDIRPERLEWAQPLAPNAHPYIDASAMLHTEALDFIEICTRPDAHCGLTELAAANGVHVLCQKPIAESRADLLAMIAATDRAGVRLMVHENWRFRPWYQTLRRRIESGEVGRPIRLRLAHRDTRALRPDGFDDQPYFRAMPRLLLFEMGPHLIDTARSLLGEIESVAATLGRFGAGHVGDDLASLSIRYRNGALGWLDMTWCAPAETARPGWALNETVIEGTEATLRLQNNGNFLRITPDGRSAEALPTTPISAPDEVYLDGYIATQKHFITGLRQGTPHATNGRDALATMDVVWAAYQSAERGATVRIEPATDPSQIIHL